MRHILINTLFKKVFFLFFIAIFFIMSIFAISTFTLQKEAILESLRSEAKTISDAITFFSEDAMITDDELNILEFTYDYVQANKHIKSIVISKDKGNSISIKGHTWSIEAISNDLLSHDEKKEETYEIITLKDSKEEVFHYTYPIKITTLYWGCIHLNLSLLEYNKKIDILKIQLIYMAILLFFTSLLLSYVIAKFFSKPIVKLDEVSKKILEGNLSYRVDIKSNDEIGNLAKTFNTMLDQSENAQVELRKSRVDLENRVSLRTIELSKLNSRLNKKSSEVTQLNKSLESRVKNEIKKQQDQEQLLIQQSKLAAMGEMIANIAHQWRQPLNALSLVIQNINFSYETEDLNDVFMNKSITKANMLTSNMSNTIDDFANFFKPDKEKVFFALESSIEESLSLLENTLIGNDIKINKDIKEIENIFGFSNEFSQAILNILTNAKDALIENKIKNAYININIYKDEDYSYLTIEDNAKGIPQDVIENIFNPYFTTKEEGKGTGIGLYMAKIIIEQNMRGSLKVQNINEGALFTIKIEHENDIL